MSRSIRVVALIACAIAVAGTTPAAPVPKADPVDEHERLLARGKRFAEQGKIDLYVAVTAAWKLKVDDLRQWEPAVDFGRKLIERAEMKGDRKPQNTPSSFKDLATYVNEYDPTFKRLDETYFRPDPDKAVPPRAFYYEAIQAPGVVDPTGICGCLVLSRGSVQAGLGIQASVVFANGDVTARTTMSSNVIVCDGDVTLTEGHINRSVIVARGNITAQSAGNIVLMAGGKVALENKGAVIKGKNPNIVLEKQPNTLGISFFELSTVGVEAKVMDKAGQITAVTDGKPFAKAGGKVGDIILEVNGKKPDSPESLRRLLRDALAIGDATVKLQRGDKTEIVKVSLPE